MGRGLSKLQRHILDRASRQERLYYSQILAEFFGWVPDATWGGRRPAVKPCGKQFSPRGVGESRYRSNMASLSRACSRLGERGLVTCLVGAVSKWSAVAITDAGRKWLSVNTVANVPTS